MEYIDPSKLSEKPLVLAGLYPFLQGKKKSNRTIAISSLNASCLVQSTCTIPGSLVIENEDLANIVIDRIELLREGILVLDMRNTVRSFVDLVKEKHGTVGSRNLFRIAEVLDENCSRVLHFDPNQSSSSYREYMKSFISKIIDDYNTGLEKKKLSDLIQKLHAHDGHLRYKDAVLLRTNLAKIDRRIESAAKFFYCSCGAESLNGIVQVPEDLYNAVHVSKLTPHISPKMVTARTERGVAHDAIVDHFAINFEAISRLTAKDIIELKSNVETRHAFSKIRSIISDIGDKLDYDDELSSHSIEMIREYHAAIAKNVKAYCLKEARRSSSISWLWPITDAVGGYSSGTPGFGLLRKAFMRLSRAVFRRNNFIGSALPVINSIELYARSLQQKISIRPSGE